MPHAIYPTTGKAQEYCPLAVNLYKGCAHGCTYCYAPAATYTSREKFNDPVPRKGIIELLEKDVATGAYKGKEVFLCFSCDPYQPIDEKHQLTRKAIQILHENEVKVRILTKASDERSLRDFDLLSARPDLSAFGYTLTFVDEDLSRKFEPHASEPVARFFALNEAHEQGIPTWVSLEPIIDPEETLKCIVYTHRYVDEFRVGKWNYDKRVKEINWPETRDRVIVLLEKLGYVDAEMGGKIKQPFKKIYYIKKDLREAK